MTAETHQGNGVFQRDAISLPLLRPVSKPPSAPPPPEVAEPVEVQAPPATAAKTPPTVQSLAKLNLDLLDAGDKVVIRTANSTYNFEILRPYFSNVIPSKSTARTGEAILMGGLSDDGTEYTPNRVYVGGRLAYQFPDEESAILTSVVESIFWVAAKRHAAV